MSPADAQGIPRSARRLANGAAGAPGIVPVPTEPPWGQCVIPPAEKAKIAALTGVGGTNDTTGGDGGGTGGLGLRRLLQDTSAAAGVPPEAAPAAEAPQAAANASGVPPHVASTGRRLLSGCPGGTTCVSTGGMKCFAPTPSTCAPPTASAGMLIWYWAGVQGRHPPRLLRPSPSRQLTFCFA